MSGYMIGSSYLII